MAFTWYAISFYIGSIIVFWNERVRKRDKLVQGFTGAGSLALSGIDVLTKAGIFTFTGIIVGIIAVAITIAEAKMSMRAGVKCVNMHMAMIHYRTD